MVLGLRTFLLAGASAALFTAPVMAQDAAPAQPQVSTVDEVVVTAQKREERLIDVPLAVQAIGSAQLERAGAGKVSDLVSAIPGASITSNATPGFETIQIRGVSSGTTGDGLVGFYIDETPFGVPNLQLTPPARLMDLERVEVIRGPSGTLYGQGSMGGTIKMVTAKPDSGEFAGKVATEYSSTSGGGDNYAVDFALNLPIVKDKFAARLSGGYESLSGYAEAPELKEKDVNGYKGRNLRLTTLWTPSEDLSVTGMFWTIRNEQKFSNSLTPHNATSAIPTYFPIPYGFPAIAGTGGKRGYTDVSADVYSMTVNWRTAIGDVVSNSSYIDHELDYFVPLLTVLVNDTNFKTKSFTQEVRINSLPDSPINWIAGAFYRDAKINSDINYYTDLTTFGLPGVTVPVIDQIGALKTKSWSVFGEASVPLLDGKLIPLVGVRYFEDDRSTDGIDRPTNQPQRGAAKYHSLNPRFNLKYKPTETAMVFFNAAKGFRSGALQTSAQAAAGDLALGLPAGTLPTQVRADSLWTYELGTRWELANRTLVLEAGVYHTDWKDVLVQFATTSVISLANGGDAEIEGLDAGLAWRTPVQGLTLNLSGNVNKTKFTKVLGSLSAGTAIKVGGDIPNVPRSNVTVSANYDRYLDWFSGSKGSLYLGYAFRDNQNDATVPGLRSGEINDLTLRASLQKDRFKIDVFANNALNDDDPSAITSTALQILYPRRIGVKVGYDF